MNHADDGCALCTTETCRAGRTLPSWVVIETPGGPAILCPTCKNKVLAAHRDINPDNTIITNDGAQ